MAKRSRKPTLAHPPAVKGIDHRLSRPDMLLEIRQHRYIEQSTKAHVCSSISANKDVVVDDVNIYLAPTTPYQFDMIFADMPFNIGKPYYINDNLSYRDYAEFMKITMRNAYQNLSDNGTFIVMNNQRNMTLIIMLAIELGFWIQNIIIWPLRAGVPSDDRLERTWQPILIFTKALTGHYFNPFADMVKHSPAADKLFGRKEKHFYENKMRRQHDIWYDIEKVSKDHPEAILNLDGTLKYANTQMPFALANRILATYCPAIGHILDMFAGSGVLCAAANTSNRKWTACEIDPELAIQIPKNIANWRNTK